MRALVALCLVLLAGAIAAVVYGIVAGRPLFVFAGGVWSLTAGDGLRRAAGSRTSGSSTGGRRPPRRHR